MSRLFKFQNTKIQFSSSNSITKPRFVQRCRLKYVKCEPIENGAIKRQVPEIYLDPVSNSVMEDPVIFVDSGIIYDQKTLNNFFDQAVEEKKIIPLTDLKTAIQKYVESLSQQDENDEADKDELEESEDDEDESEDEKDDEIENDRNNLEIEDDHLKDKAVSSFEKFIQQTAEVRSQNDKIEALSTKFKSFEQSLSSVLQNYQSQLGQISEKFSEVDVMDPNQDIADIRIQFAQENQKLQQIAQICNEGLLPLWYQRTKFEEQLDLLKNREEKLEKTREDLIQVSRNIIDPNFQIPISKSLSQNFQPLKKVSYEELSDLLNDVSSPHPLQNISVDFKTNKGGGSDSDGYFQISVDKNLHLKRFHFTNTGNEFYGLYLRQEESECHIVIEDCIFEGIGLYVDGQNSDEEIYNTQVVVRNCEFSNSPQNGLSICNFTTGLIQQVNVDGCSQAAIKVRDTDVCQINGVQIQNSELGIVYIRAYGLIQGCSIVNCSDTGVQVEDGTVVGERVQFEDTEIDTDGNYFELYPSIST